MRYRHPDFHGVALFKNGYPKRWEPYTTTIVTECDDPECHDEHEIDTGDGEWVEDTESGKVYVTMVGDDHKHLVDEEDLVQIKDSEYCTECGQIDCGWGAREDE